MKLNSPFIASIRGRGLLNAIVIKHENPEAAWDLCLHLKELGILAKPTHGDKIRFAPPLIINDMKHLIKDFNKNDMIKLNAVFVVSIILFFGSLIIMYNKYDSL